MPVDFQSSLALLLHSFAMVASAVQLAKIALVSLLLAWHSNMLSRYNSKEKTTTALWRRLSGKW